MGFKLAVKVTFSNGIERTANIDLPEHVMTASPSRLRKLVMKKVNIKNTFKSNSFVHTPAVIIPTSSNPDASCTEDRI